MSHIPSKHKESLPQGARGCVRRNDVRAACAASREIPVDQHVAVGGVSAVMFTLEIAIEPADLLPLHDREDGIQGIEIRDLNIGGIDILRAAAGEGNALPHMIPLLRRTGGDTQDAAQRPLVELKSHADIDERGTDRLELLHDQPLRVSSVEGQECEGDAVKKVEIVGAQRGVVRHDIPVHLAVDALEILDLLGRLSQFLQARSAWRAKRIVGQELVVIEETDFADRRLGDQIQNVAASPTDADNRDPLVDEALGQEADPDTIGRGLDIVEDAVLLLFRLTESARRGTGLQHRGRTRDDVRVTRHLVVVICVPPVRLAGEAMRRFQAVAEVKGAGLMRDALDGRPIGAAREVAIPMDYMGARGVGRASLITGQQEAGDERTDAHLAMRIDIGHLPHDDVAALLLDEVTFVPQPLEVRITTEQCA